MKKILITGNGFDLSYNLPTSYNDFINILKLIESATKTLTPEKIYKQSIFSETLSQYTSDIKIDQSGLNTLAEKSNSNIWYKFFKHELEIESWIDFEQKIEYALSNILSSFEEIEKAINEMVFNSRRINQNLLIPYKEYDINVHQVYILEKFNFFIQNKNPTIYEFSKQFLTVTNEIYSGINYDKSIVYIENELNDFIELFSIYIREIVFPIYSVIKTNELTHLFSNIEEHFTFNYTPTFEIISRKQNNPFIGTSFIHGKISSNEHNIVLGINDIPNGVDKNKKVIPFTKYFQRLYKNTDYSFLSKFKNIYNKYENIPISFFFLGHSLDLSDSDYINEVFDFVFRKNEKKSNATPRKMSKIIIIYHNDESRYNMLANLLVIRGKEDIDTLMRTKDLVFFRTDSNELKKELNKTNSSSKRSQVISRGG